MAWKGRKIQKISEITQIKKLQVENVLYVTWDQLKIRDFDDDDDHHHHHFIRIISSNRHSGL